MRKRLSSSLAKTCPDYPGRDAIVRYAAYLTDEGAAVVILFGSVARGDYGPDSDADLLVIFDDNRTRNELWSAYYGPSGGEVEPHFWTLKRAEEELALGNPFLMLAFFDGILLYEKDGAYARLKTLFKSAVGRMGITRERDGLRYEVTNGL
jgi:hypothetical protein